MRSCSGGHALTRRRILSTPPRARSWPHITAPNPIRLVRDLGPVGQGVSNARFCQAENGTEYLIKSPLLDVNNPFVGANETVAAELALLLGLPTVEWRLIVHQGEVYFGAQRALDIAPIFDQVILNSLDNQDRLYDMVAFDVFITNMDRHNRNITARKVQNEPDKYLLLLIDHSHAVIPPGLQPPDLAGRVQLYAPQLVRCSEVRAALTDKDRLQQGANLITALSDNAIRDAVEKVPDRWLTPAQRQMVATALQLRRNGMGVLMNHLSHDLPNLR